MNINKHTFAGLQIAPANLIFDGKRFAIAKNWKENSYRKTPGKKAGSTYFNWHECHDVNVEGWRVPSREEWADIVGSQREGSVYNGQPHTCFALIQVDVPFGEREVCNGLLLFPDEASINGVVIDNINKTHQNDRNNYRQTKGITEEQLNDLLAQGCAFLPASGYFIDGDWNDGGGYGFYWSSIEYDEGIACSLYFGASYLDPDSSGSKSDDYYSVRLVRE